MAFCWANHPPCSWLSSTIPVVKRWGTPKSTDLSHMPPEIAIDWDIHWFWPMKIPTMWGPRSIAKLVNITPITMVYDTQITIVNGIYKLTYNWGAPHCTDLSFSENPEVTTSSEWTRSQHYGADSQHFPPILGDFFGPSSWRDRIWTCQKHDSTGNNFENPIFYMPQDDCKFNPIPKNESELS